MNTPNSGEVWAVDKISPDGGSVGLVMVTQERRPPTYRRDVPVAEVDGKIPPLKKDDTGTITKDGKFLLLGCETPNWEHRAP